MLRYSLLIFLYFLLVFQWSASSYELDELLNSFIERSSSTEEDDPNDRVDIDRWNRLNEQDIKNAPKINDYSDENNALRWLTWYSRVSLRYYQVKSPLRKKKIFVCNISFAD